MRTDAQAGIPQAKGRGGLPGRGNSIGKGLEARRIEQEDGGIILDFLLSLWRW